MPGLEVRPSPAARSIALAALRLLLAIAPFGCGGLSVREPWLRNAIEDRKERLQATNQLSSATGAVLLRYDLLDTAARDPAAQPASSKRSSRPSRCTTGPWRWRSSRIRRAC